MLGGSLLNLKNKVTANHLVFFLRILLGSVFLISGLSKFLDIPKFEESIFEFHILPVNIVPIAAWIIPSTESLSALTLLFGIMTRQSAGIIISLLIIFVAAIIPILASPSGGSNIECGCFGVVANLKIGIPLLIRNLVLIGIGVIILLHKSNPFSISNYMDHRRR
jgi:uncharacterized membrane protein YphA (DoxX/SURF4 family)